MPDRFLRLGLLRWGVALLLGLAWSQVQAASAHPWAGLSLQERTALAPLAQTWDGFPAEQQLRLLAVAKRYPELTPQQQRLLQKRLKSWTRLMSKDVARGRRSNASHDPPHDLRHYRA